MEPPAGSLRRRRRGGGMVQPGHAAGRLRIGSLSGSWTPRRPLERAYGRHAAAPTARGRPTPLQPGACSSQRAVQKQTGRQADRQQDSPCAAGGAMGPAASQAAACHRLPGASPAGAAAAWRGQLMLITLRTGMLAENHVQRREAWQEAGAAAALFQGRHQVPVSDDEARCVALPLP